MNTRALIFDYYGVLASQVQGGWQLDMKLINLIQNLKRDYKIGLSSNSYAKSVTELNAQLDPKLFDVVSIGGVTGLWKPDKRVYDALVAELDAQPAEILIVDDNKKYIDAAASLGFATLLYHDISDLQKFLRV